MKRFVGKVNGQSVSHIKPVMGKFMDRSSVQKTKSDPKCFSFQRKFGSSQQDVFLEDIRLGSQITRSTSGRKQTQQRAATALGFGLWWWLGRVDGGKQGREGEEEEEGPAAAQRTVPHCSAQHTTRPPPRHLPPSSTPHALIKCSIRL